jgi:hypothetical protein
MSEDAVRSDALDALNEIRARDFPEIPEETVRAMFELEDAAQFESDRGPTVAKLRDLIAGEDES